MERCLLVTIELRTEKDSWPKQDVARELEELVKTANGQAIEQIFCLRDRPTPDLFIGKGKVEEIALLSQDEDIDTVIFSHDLSGTQQRNLEEIIGKKTIDRTQLILDIFSHHAHSPEGNMQVELAQLEYLLPRLVGKGIMLSRLGGGIGTRGPGEQKLEVDRRRIRNKITKLKQDLEHLTNHRRIIRKKRKEEAIPCLALVGYTNAGKSTLLNRLAEAEVYVADQLFATLDPTTRRVELPGGHLALFTDTVGFIQKLPTALVAAFRATLEEIAEADLLLHLLDVTHPNAHAQSEAVMQTLKEIEADHIPVVTALNKIDRLPDPAVARTALDLYPSSVAISALTGEGTAGLLELVDRQLYEDFAYVTVRLPYQEGSLIALFHEQGQIELVEQYHGGTMIRGRLPGRLLARYQPFVVQG